MQSRPLRLCCLPALVAALLLSQSPPLSPGRKFTTLERLETSHLKEVHQARLRFARDRREIPRVGVYQDFRAVLHVHAEDATHTLGTRAGVLEGAKKAGVRAVLFTDHRGPKPDTWRGTRDGVLFLAGAEDDHLLRFPASDGDLRFLSHSEELSNPGGAGFQGMEIYNRHTDSSDEKEFNEYFRRAMKDPAEWSKLVEKERQYPDEVFAAQADYWPLLFKTFDAQTQKEPFTAISANDAHQNQVYQGTVFDPYEVSFRNVSTHVLARELTEAGIRDSLRNGHAYVAHDWLCDPTGFTFQAANNQGVFDMGDRVPLVGTTHLQAVLPLAARLKLFHNGKLIQEAFDSRLSFEAKEPGAYRLEAWLPVDGEERPWIYSNPIYPYRFDLASYRFPSTDTPPDVSVEKDIPYAGGSPEDAAKHKLDVYVPKSKTNLPVFVFIHGGSWRNGDRSNYPALGNHFAQKGIVVAIPSYRLMPKNPHPAQIEDVAAAFAWVAKNIGQYGGDPKRIYIGGHSAGGHLVSLLALDGKYLARYSLSPRNIQAVLALSGVYDVRAIAAFGDDTTKHDASPLFHVSSASPRFLITFCQWDYPSLPNQARDFEAALGKVQVETQLVYVPGETHITEIINAVKDDDATSRAILSVVH